MYQFTEVAQSYRQTSIAVFPKLFLLAEKFNDYCIVNKHSHRINLDQLTLEDEQ